MALLAGQQRDPGSPSTKAAVSAGGSDGMRGQRRAFAFDPELPPAPADAFNGTEKRWAARRCPTCAYLCTSGILDDSPVRERDARNRPQAERHADPRHGCSAREGAVI